MAYELLAEVCCSFCICDRRGLFARFGCSERRVRYWVRFWVRLRLRFGVTCGKRDVLRPRWRSKVSYPVSEGTTANLSMLLNQIAAVASVAVGTL